MKKGVILLNMGGPNNLDEVEVFLKNMFNDKNIINIKNRTIRGLVAFMITTSRKKIAKKNYELLGGKSPIVENTEMLVEKLNRKNRDILVDYAMAYTRPFASSAIENLFDCNEVLVIPLYPHYSTTTIKSSMEDFYLHVDKMGAKFSIKTIDEFYDNLSYNKLLIKLIKDEVNKDSAKDFDLIFSAHSLPQKIVDRGDPYERQIEKHVEILKNLLVENNLYFNKTHIAYQSKLGPIKWLEPELGNVLKDMDNKRVIIFPISFTIDNSETNFELSMEYKHVASEFNFVDYRVCKCPNYSDGFVDFLLEIVDDNL